MPTAPSSCASPVPTCSSTACPSSCPFSGAACESHGALATDHTPQSEPRGSSGGISTGRPTAAPPSWQLPALSPPASSVRAPSASPHGLAGAGALLIRLAVTARQMSALMTTPLPPAAPGVPLLVPLHTLSSAAGLMMSTSSCGFAGHWCMGDLSWEARKPRSAQRMHAGLSKAWSLQLTCRKRAARCGSHTTRLAQPR